MCDGRSKLKHPQNSLLSHRTSCSWLRHSSVASANNRPHKTHRTRPATRLKVYIRSTLPCEESYRDRLLSIDILPICYWHEVLDLVFFFKATNGIVCVSHDVLPERIVPTRVTRASASNAKSFRPKKCRTSTYQHSFFVRTSRSWNALPLKLRYEHVTLN